MCQQINSKWLTCLMISVILFLACPASFSSESDGKLAQQLARIRSQNKGEGTDWGKLEAECLTLIQDHNSPEEKGKIYATIALIYAEKGWSSSEDIRIPKALKFCKKALDYPLEATTACKMYGGWADSLMVEYWEHAEEEFVKLRREAIVPCLTGLKLALDNKAPKKLPPPPAVHVYTISPSSPDYEKLMNKYKQELAARKKWEFESQLYFQRKALTQRYVSLYSHKPYDIEELQHFADQILKDHPDVVEELLTEVKGKIAEKAKNSAPNQGSN